MKHLKTYENKDEDIKFDWDKFIEYVNTYDTIKHAGDDWHIIMEDMLYGLGICIDEEEFKGANGYKKFRQYLRDGVSWILREKSKKYNL